LKQQLQDADSSRVHAQDLNSTNQDLYKKIQELEGHLKKTLSISKTRLQKLGEANKAVAAMQVQVDHKDVEVSQAQARVVESERLVAAAQAEAATNENEMWAQQAKASQAYQEAQRLEGHVAELSKSKMQAQLRIHELEMEVDSARSAREALSRSSAEERMGLQKEADTLREELEAVLRKQEATDAELHRLRNANGAASEGDRVALKLSQQEVFRLESELEDSERSKSKLQSEIDGIKAASIGEDVMKQELERLRAKEIEWLQEKERLNRLQADAHAESLKLREEMNGLEAEMLESSEDLRASQSKLSVAGEKEDSLLSEIKEKDATQSALETAYAKLLDENRILEKERMDQASKNAEPTVDSKKIKDALAKLNNAQEAMEGVLTCMNCMEVYQGPMTYNPCGHTFCKSCCEQSKDRNGGSYHCDECGSGKPVKSVSANSLIDEVAGKFLYQKQVIGALQKKLG